jgi:branched-chain amino acid transport system substrate-binding protein
VAAPQGATAKGAADASKPAAAAGKAAKGAKTGGAAKTGGSAPAAASGGSLPQQLAAKGAAYKMPAAKAASGAPVLIGNVGTYSGVGGILNQGTQASLRIWTAWVNAHGGLNGHQVKLESYDDQGDPATAVSFAKQLDSKGAIAFLWNYSLFTSQTLIPAISKMGIPWIGGDDFDPAMYTTPFMFPNNTPVRYQDATTAAYAKSLGKTVAAEWWCIEAYACQRAQQSDDANGGLASAGQKVVMNVSVSLTQPSYLSQCSTAKQKGVQYIMAHLDGASFIRAKRDCNQIGFDPMICNVAGAITPQLLTTEGTKGPDEVCFGVSSFPWWASETPMQKAFQDAIAQYAPGTPTAYGSSGVWAAGEILRSSSKFLSGSPTRADLLKGLYSVKDETFGGLTYPLTYMANPSVQKPLPFFNCGYVAVVTEQGKWDFSPGKQFYCTPKVSDISKI